MIYTISPDMVEHEMSFYEAAPIIVKHGYFDGYFSWVIERDTVKGIEATKEVFKKYNLKPTGFVLPGSSAIYDGTDEESEKLFSELEPLISVASEVGYTYVFNWIIPRSNERTYKENYKIHVERLRRICNLLKKYGLKDAIEFIGPYSFVKIFEYPFIHTAEEALKLCEDIGTGNVGITLDCYHWYTSGALDDDYMKTFTSGKQIVQTHINDGIAGLARDEQQDQVRELPGATGIINLDNFFKCLKNLDYDGPVIIEPFNKRLANLTFEETLDELMESFEKVLPKIK